jgi:hypothetical protein
MVRSPFQILLAAAIIAALAIPAHAVGEEILAHTGQYTFFIKPDPSACVTYYQKLVPCIERKATPVVRPVIETYPVPIAVIRGQRAMITETPVGCAGGCGSCLECYPTPTRRPGPKEVVEPHPIPVPVHGMNIDARWVQRPVKRPQWFMVEEHPMPPHRKGGQAPAGR